MRNKDADLRAEIESHLEMAIADRIARGAPPEEAAAAARRELGNLSQIQEAARDVWGRRWIGQVAQDVRYALRTCRRNPGFAIVAILSLTLGIGANTALFEVVNAVRLRTLPIPEPSTLVEVRLTDMDGVRGNQQTWHAAVTQPIWREIQARQQALSGPFVWSRTAFNLAESGEAKLAEGLWVSGDFFTALGIRPAAGRLLSRDDDRPGCSPRAVLGHGFWRRAYGADPSVVGQIIALDSRRAEIVGVAESGFYGLEVGRAFDLILPLCAEPAFSDDGKGRLDAGTTWWLSVFGRLKPGWSVERAAAHFDAMSPAVFRASLPPGYPPVSVERYLNFKLSAYPGGSGLSQLREAYEMPLWLLLAIAGLVLVIACANLANLLFARASAREREIAVRLGLGASRGRVIRQLLTESVLLVMIGAAGATLLAAWLGRWLVSALETADSPITLPLAVDWNVLGFTCALALATCLLFGLAPAIRGTSVEAAAVMRGGSRGATAGRRSVTIRRILVAVQIALSLSLLFGSLLFARTLRNVLNVDPGFRAEGLIVARLNLTGLETPADQRPMTRRHMIDLLAAVPGIESAAPVAVVPFSGSSGGNEIWPEGDRTHGVSTSINIVGRGYFATMGIPLLAGRDFDARDTPASTAVAIVNETFAARLGGPAATVGRRVTREATPRQPEKTFEIVGVVSNSTYESLKEDTHPVAYYADEQDQGGRYVQVIIRAAVPPARATSAITAALASADRRIKISYAVLPAMIQDSLVQERVLAALSGGFGALAALLTVVGLYGLIAYSVSRRTGEIGIRMALGATRWDIVRIILVETGLLLAIGTGCGVALAIAGGRAAATLLFRIEPYDPAMLAAAVGLLAAIAVAASVAPARRATRIEPVAALRAD
jgi:predicted permease